MLMKVTFRETGIRDLRVVENDSFSDPRGFFIEVFNSEEFSKAGLDLNVVQSNHSGSVKGVLRGLHFQWEPPMGKLMRVSRGSAYLVAVDIRLGSPTLGKYFGIEVSDQNRLQVYAPAGFARGFCVTSDYAEVQYLCTGTYNNAAESGISWCDPAIGIAWPEIPGRIISAKDEKAQSLADWLARPEAHNFTY
jgi:dTDP-4-dehydrorhamnose 3,5-epimerase